MLAYCKYAIGYRLKATKVPIVNTDVTLGNHISIKQENSKMSHDNSKPLHNQATCR